MLTAAIMLMLISLKFLYAKTVIANAARINAVKIRFVPMATVILQVKSETDLVTANLKMNMIFAERVIPPNI